MSSAISPECPGQRPRKSVAVMDFRAGFRTDILLPVAAGEETSEHRAMLSAMKPRPDGSTYDETSGPRTCAKTTVARSSTDGVQTKRRLGHRKKGRNVFA